MPRMVRKQICIDEELDQALAERARSLGVSQGAVVRAALRRDIEGSQDAELKAAWTRVLGSMERLLAAGPSGPTNEGQGRGWTREDLYDNDDGSPRGFRVGSARGRERSDLCVGQGRAIEADGGDTAAEKDS